VHKLIKEFHNTCKGKIPVLPDALMKLSKAIRSNIVLFYAIQIGLLYVTFSKPLMAWNHKEVF